MKLFFCAIRKCGGLCANPTSTQLATAYNILSIQHEIAATNGNVDAMDSTSILYVPSGRSQNKKDFYDLDVFDDMANVRVMKKYG